MWYGNKARAGLAYRVRRQGEDVWLTDAGCETSDPDQAARFGSATEACLWMLSLELSSTWTWETCFGRVPVNA